MKKIKKIILATAFTLIPLIAFTQEIPITHSSKYSKEFWDKREGFKHIERDTTYSVINSKEIFKIENAEKRITITDTNHYGNVEQIIIENKKNESILRFSKGEISPEGGAYLYYFPPTIPKNEAFEEYIKWDKIFRKYKASKIERIFDSIL